MRKAVSSILVVVLSMVVAAVCVREKWYLKNKRWDTRPELNDSLVRLGHAALSSSDVPVGSLILYDGKIIGSGYNTVRRDVSAAGHAEVNAISDAMKRVGFDSFMHIDRERILLVTTWEPCNMCKGAIIEYNISHVVVLKMKSEWYWWKNWKKTFSYEWNKRDAGDDSLQDHLFSKHPAFKDQNGDF